MKAILIDGAPSMRGVPRLSFSHPSFILPWEQREHLFVYLADEEPGHREVKKPGQGHKASDRASKAYNLPTGPQCQKQKELHLSSSAFLVLVYLVNGYTFTHI